MTDDDVAKIGALFEAFRAEERASAIASMRLQRITFQRNFGVSGQMNSGAGLEVTIDQNASADEIYGLVERFDQAMDRHKAKIDLSEHLARIDQMLAQLETGIRNRAEREVTFRADNAARNQNRRVAITFTSQQQTDLRNMDQAVKDTRTRIAELWEMVGRARQILGGANPFEVLEKELREREDLTRHQAVAA